MLTESERQMKVNIEKENSHLIDRRKKILKEIKTIDKQLETNKSYLGIINKKISKSGKNEIQETS